MTVFNIDFEPVGLRGQVTATESLSACARRLGIGISNVCGGKGTCHTCKVRVVSGTTTPPTPHEIEALTPPQLKQGWRLACQTRATGDLKLMVPPESLTAPQRVQVEGWEVKVKAEPPVRAYTIDVPPPSLEAPRGDADRLLAALQKEHRVSAGLDFDVLRTLSPRLREWDGKCRAIVRGAEVIAVLPAGSRHLGLAVDLGTTKIAGYLVDMKDGQVLAARGVMNPQISYGEDIISRITGIVRSPEEATPVQQLAAEGINALAADLCREAGAGPEEITEAVVVGNTAMHHLLLGLPVRQLSLAPFVPAVSRALDVKAAALGLKTAPGAYVHLLPNIAGYVGGDHVAALLATGLAETAGPAIVLDIGTNTEVSLASGGKLTATSCASGPAFEGGHIENGMRAAPGAIERFRLAGGELQYQTVAEAPPAGICGSGILDTLAQLYLAGIINEGGRMADKHPRVRTRREQREFVIVSEEERGGRAAIVMTQADVRELQLAKAAIRSGIQALLEASGTAEADIAQVIIAGAFGTYIDVASAVAVGMLPALPLERFRQVGNAAGMGARMALVSRRRREEAAAMAGRVGYIELASAPGFNQTFLQASYLGKYRIKDSKREVIS